MRRMLAVLNLWALLLPVAASASGIGITNKFGTVSVTNAGIVSRGAELIGFNGITAPPGHDLGSVSFSTGALSSGSIFGGGTFSSTGSSLIVIGVGKYGQPRGTIFNATFVGPIHWNLVSHTGRYDYVFELGGRVSGEMYTGRFISGITRQTISLNQNQWLQNQRGGLDVGTTSFMVSPEPGTLGLVVIGLIALVVSMQRKLFRS